MKFSFIGFVGSIVASSILFTGCGNNDDAGSEVLLETKSFLEGGSYGSWSIKSVPFDGSSTLPFLGNISFGLQPYYAFGGVKSSYGDSYEIYGNSKINSPLILKYVFAQKEAGDFGVSLYMKKDSKIYCITQDNGKLKAVDDEAQIEYCSKNPLIKSLTFDTNKVAQELTIDLGSLTEDRYYVFTLFANKDGNLTPLTWNNGDKYSTILQVNDIVTSNHPENLIASTGFLPSPDGFGFLNTGSKNYNELAVQDIARIYGANSVCYNDDETNCALSALGHMKLNSAIGSQEGGQCYGFALASMMLKNGVEFKGKTKSMDYNQNAKTTVMLNKSDVDELIAFKHLNQFTPEIQEHFGSTCSTYTPMDVIENIKEGIAKNDPVAILAFFDEEYTHGHAVTPYGVSKEVDGIYRIHVYDNNYPADSNRYFEINSSLNSWKYISQTNSNAELSQYKGEWWRNTLCTIPLSMQQYYKISEQETNSTLFKNKGDPASRITIQDYITKNITGYDKVSDKELSGIPNTRTIKTFEEPQPQYEISKLTKDINFFYSPLVETLTIDLIKRYQLESYIVSSVLLDDENTDSTEEMKMMSTQQTTVSDLHAAGMWVEMQGKSSDNKSYTTRFHPSARVVSIDGDVPFTAKLFFDDKKSREGIFYEIKADGNTPGAVTTFLITDELGALIVASVNESGISYDNIKYTVTGSFTDIDGVISSEQLNVSQRVGTTMKISSKKSQSTLRSLNRKKRLEGFELAAETLF